MHPFAISWTELNTSSKYLYFSMIKKKTNFQKEENWPLFSKLSFNPLVRSLVHFIFYYKNLFSFYIYFHANKGTIVFLISNCLLNSSNKTLKSNFPIHVFGVVYWSVFLHLYLPLHLSLKFNNDKTEPVSAAVCQCLLVLVCVKVRYLTTNM